MQDGTAKPSTTADRAAPCPAVPFCVHLQTDNGGRVREAALWKLDGAKLNYNPRALKLCSEVGIHSLQSTADKTVELEARKAIEPYLSSAFCAGGYKQKFVRLQLDVPLGSRCFRDEPLWDAADAQNTAEGYASAVCRALGLNWDAARHIRAAVQEQLRTGQPVEDGDLLSGAPAGDLGPRLEDSG